ncbi:MAG: hypothetical protein Q9184_007497 [Pyrenodesmia sp. 2 TL-2023]
MDRQDLVYLEHLERTYSYLGHGPRSAAQAAGLRSPKGAGLGRSDGARSKGEGVNSELQVPSSNPDPAPPFFAELTSYCYELSFQHAVAHARRCRWIGVDLAGSSIEAYTACASLDCPEPISEYLAGRCQRTAMA